MTNTIKTTILSICLALTGTTLANSNINHDTEKYLLHNFASFQFLVNDGEKFVDVECSVDGKPTNVEVKEFGFFTKTKGWLHKTDLLVYDIAKRGAVIKCGDTTLEFPPLKSPLIQVGWIIYTDGEEQGKLWFQDFAIQNMSGLFQFQIDRDYRLEFVEYKEKEPSVYDSK